MRYIDDAIVPPFLNLLSFFPDNSLIKLFLELPTFDLEDKRNIANSTILNSPIEEIISKYK